MTTKRRVVESTVPLDAADHLPELRTALEQQRQFRLDQLRELAESESNSSLAVGDVHDQVGQILRSSATTALVEVEAALDRMDAGDYGRCVRCTTHIPYERLEILPMSRYCMRCQHDLEMRSAKA